MVRRQLSKKATTNIRRRYSRLNRRQGGSSDDDFRAAHKAEVARLEGKTQSSASDVKAIDDKKKTFNVKLLNRQTGKIVKVEAPQDATIRDFKNRIADELRIQNPESIKLSLDFHEKEWKDTRLNELAWHYSIPFNFDYEDKNAEEQQTTSEDDGPDY